jgi:hypothetical protein
MCSNADPAAWGGTANKHSSTTWDIAVHEVTWNVNPTFIENSDELRGYTSNPWHDGAGTMALELTAKARVRPNMLGLLCYMVTSGAVGESTGTTTDHVGTAVGAGAYQHAYSWTTADVPRTATIYFAPTKGAGWAASGCGLTTLAFSFEDSGAMIADMTFRGLYFAANTTSITPAYESDVPLKKNQICFGGVNDDSGDTDSIFGATTSKATDINWAIENNLSNFFAFGDCTGSVWPDSIEYEDLWARVSGSVTKRQVLAADYERWTGKGADKHFNECFQGTGDYLAGTSGPKFRFYFHIPAAQWMAMNPEAITNKRRIGVTFDWEARTDADGTGNWCDIFVVNSQDPTLFITPTT